MDSDSIIIELINLEIAFDVKFCVWEYFLVGKTS